jgi:hypothetical protein
VGAPNLSEYGSQYGIWSADEWVITDLCADADASLDQAANAAYIAAANPQAILALIAERDATRAELAQAQAKLAKCGELPEKWNREAGGLLVNVAGHTMRGVYARCRNDLQAVLNEEKA